MIFKSHGKGYDFELNTNRFDVQNRDAQKKLNMLVVSDSTPYIPFQQGQLRSQVRYPDGIYGEIVEWYAPYAHYQYEGELYLTASGSSWAQRGEVKYPSGRPLSYHENGTTDHWFEKAKSVHGSEWLKAVRRIGGGK